MSTTGFTLDYGLTPIRLIGPHAACDEVFDTVMTDLETDGL